MLKKIKEVAHVLSDVLGGKAFVETLVPTKRNKVEISIFRPDGSLKAYSCGYNSRVNAGALWQATLMGSAAGTPANYMALSATVLTPAATDTTLSGEITAGTNSGLARSQGTYGGYSAPASLGAQATYTISKTFTSSASTTVNSAAMFNASSGGSLFVEANLSPAATLANGDQLVLTWTINI
jgi:hypothetical protein